MEFIRCEIPDVVLVKPKIFQDQRGFFFESYKRSEFCDAGICADFVQDNHSSSKKFTLRGVHYQIKHTQGKLVRAVIGEVFDVAVDLRKNSPYFGKWVGAFLSAKNKNQLWIPPGFGHAFYTISKRADVIYKATDYYDPQGDRSIRWNDPDLAIDWPLEGNHPIVSPKDANAPFLKEAEIFL